MRHHHSLSAAMLLSVVAILAPVKGAATAGSTKPNTHGNESGGGWVAHAAIAGESSVPQHARTTATCLPGVAPPIQILPDDRAGKVRKITFGRTCRQDRLELEAIASPHYDFKEWGGAPCDGSTHPTCITKLGTSDADPITAVFAKQTFQLQTAVVPFNGGSVSPASGTYVYGSTVTFTATPSSGFEFGGWYGCDSPSGEICTQTVHDSRTVHAAFTQPFSGDEEVIPISDHLAIVPCSSGTVGVIAVRNSNYTGPITLTATATGGLNATFNPTQLTGTQTTSLLTVQPTGRFPAGSEVRASATTQNSDARGFMLRVSPANTTVSAVLPGKASAPFEGRSSSTIRLVGSGFCPSSTFTFAGGETVASAEISAVGDTARLQVPEGAVSGPITVSTSGSADAQSPPLTIDEYRSGHGFQFENGNFGGADWQDIEALYGDDQTHVTVNPCWPFDCTVQRRCRLRPLCSGGVFRALSWTPRPARATGWRWRRSGCGRGSSRWADSPLPARLTRSVSPPRTSRRTRFAIT
jgi:Divergent InlB B-repeat domain